MGQALTIQCDSSAAECVVCQSAAEFKGDGVVEDVHQNCGDMDGDVKNSQAMVNHKLLKASRDGDTLEIQQALVLGAYVETRRPFVVTPDSGPLPGGGLQVRGTGLTPLMYAAQGGYSEACQVLLSSGACVNAEDEDGLRPLHFAASSGNMETCRVLLLGGADPTARDDDGSTALDHVPAACSQAEKRHWELLLAATPAKVDGASSPAGAVATSSALSGAAAGA